MYVTKTKTTTKTTGKITIKRTQLNKSNNKIIHNSNNSDKEN